MIDYIKAAVIGYPVAHSKSPVIHAHWIEKYCMKGLYEPIEIAPENLKEGIQELIDEDFSGFNVTIPHKQAVMELCDVLDPAAKSIGAVNTVLIKDGQLHGYNTDAYGFIENLKQERPDFSVTEKPVTILGAGGAARAIVYALLREGVSEIRIANRSMKKTKDIQKMAPENIIALPWEEREDSLTACGLLVNTTPLGMDGQPPLQIDWDGTQSSMVVYDIVYTPLMTDLLKTAKAHKHPIVTGIGMLLHQARPAFEAWFGILPDIDDDLLSKVQI